jgi:hypothetical protein
MKTHMELQAGSTYALWHTYDVDEDVIFPFQQATKVIDPPRNSSSMAKWWWRKIPAGICKACTREEEGRDGG